VKLQTSLYDASTGRSGGGNFQLVTKSGGNRFTGSAYYYLQNKAFNANEFFPRRSRSRKTESRPHLKPDSPSAVRLSKTNFSFSAVINSPTQHRTRSDRENAHRSAARL
jgi:hypothetical protein